jgi:hypothetical protein
MSRNNQIIHGNNQSVSGNNITIYGNNNKISGAHHHINGNNNMISGVSHNIMGNNNKISGSYHTIMGDSNLISGSQHSIEGNSNKISGQFNRANGTNNIIEGYGNEKNGNNWYNNPYNPVDSIIINQNNGVLANSIVGNIISNVNGVSNCSDSFNIYGNTFQGKTVFNFDGKYHANNVHQMGDNTTNYFNNKQVPHHDVQTMGNNTTNSSAQNNDKQVPQKPKPIITVAQLARDELAEDGHPTCIICTENKPNVLFTPCSHMMLCAHCTEKLFKKEDMLCPNCRTVIDGVFVVFK